MLNQIIKYYTSGPHSKAVDDKLIPLAAIQTHHKPLFLNDTNSDRTLNFQWIVQKHPIIRPQQAKLYDEELFNRNPAYKRAMNAHHVEDYFMRDPVEWIDDNNFSRRTNIPTIPITILYPEDGVDYNPLLARYNLQHKGQFEKHTIFGHRNFNNKNQY